MKIAAYVVSSALIIGGILFGLSTIPAIPQVWILITGLILAGIAIASIAGKVVTTKKTSAGGDGSTSVTEKQTTVE